MLLPVSDYHGVLSKKMNSLKTEEEKIFRIKQLLKKKEIAEKKLQHLKKYKKPQPYLLKGIWGSI